MKTMTIVVTFLCLAALCAAAQNNDMKPADDPVAVLHELHAYEYRDNKPIPLEERDYERLVTILPAVLRIAEEQQGLWRIETIDSNNRLKPPFVAPWYFTLDHALAQAAIKAPSKVEKEKWLRLRISFATRFLHDPKLRQAIDRLHQRIEKTSDAASDPVIASLTYDFSPKAVVLSQKVFHGKLRLDPPKGKIQDFDYLRLVSNAQGNIAGARMWLKHEKLLPPDDWGISAGLEWWSTQDKVQRHNGVLYVAASALRSLGIPIQLNATGVRITNGLHTAQIAIGKAQDFTSRRGFRDKNSGELFVPLEEIDRHGLYKVELWERGQIAVLEAEPPVHSEKPSDAVKPSESKK